MGSTAMCYKRYPSYRALGIPKGHLPPPGKCKIWQPGAPPGQQGSPMDKEMAFRQVPPGYWVIERPGNDEDLIYIHQMHEHRRRVVIEVEIYTMN